MGEELQRQLDESRGAGMGTTVIVVDHSRFVFGGAQNPTLTIMALALRASEYLAEQLRQLGVAAGDADVNSAVLWTAAPCPTRTRHNQGQPQRDG